jgi:tRNA U34 5-carboxymethylaminomethyl modifying GTPase MnmE/TrmE
MPLIPLHSALQDLGEITGEVTIDDIYQHIFQKFCIGK